MIRTEKAPGVIKQMKVKAKLTIVAAMSPDFYNFSYTGKL
jgi:hypothetical protein